jgi:aspartate kinase
MPIVVQKYGGSSVADVERLKKVATRVVETARAGKQVCVVVSAMGDTTDELIGLARKLSGTPHRREMDMLLSCGERISMALLSMAIAELGQEAISFTGSQSGIMTNDRHSGARIIEVRPVRIQDELDRGRIVIVAGFQGVSYKREITTLGRGGSDTTAVALAAALGAEYCEICSDVDGVYSADPRVVDAARLLEAISYDEMQELAEHGARVMNPQAVEFARKAGIAIYARATAGAPGEGGTRIGGPAGEAPGGVGVAGMHELVRVQVSGAGAAHRVAGHARRARAAARHRRGGRERAVLHRRPARLGQAEGRAGRHVPGRALRGGPGRGHRGGRGAGLRRARPGPRARPGEGAGHRREGLRRVAPAPDPLRGVGAGERAGRRAARRAGRRALK